MVLRNPRSEVQVIRGSEPWRELLADPPAPDWNAEVVAARLLEMWASGGGYVEPLRSAFAGTDFESFEPVLAIPQYEVSMPGGRVPGHNDLCLLGRIGPDEALIMAHGKLDARPGEHLDEWLHNPSPAKLRRIGFLQDVLSLPDNLSETINYQVLNRVASAYVEAQRQGIPHAASVITVFGTANGWMEEYGEVVGYLGLTCEPGRIQRVTGRTDPTLWVGCVESLDDR